MRVSDLSIGTRLTIAFGAIATLVASMAGLGLVLMSSVKDGFVALEEVDNRKLRLSTVLLEQTDHLMLNASRGADPKVETGQRAHAADAASLHKAYDEAWAALVALPAADADETRARTAIDAASQTFRQSLAAGPGGVAATALEAAYKSLSERIAAILQRHEKARERALADANATYRRAAAMLVVITILCLALSAWAGWYITRSIVRPIHYVRDCALRMARGDFTQRVERRTTPQPHHETAQLIAAMQTMHDSVCQTVGHVITSATSLATSAQQMSVGNADLAARTERQAANLQQATVAVQALTLTMQRNAHSTDRAAELASGAGSIADRGGDVAQRVVQTMGSIDEGSRKIADILGVIDNIAFQTNILALNAAVEAARAGTHGSGFAVVAAEVRSLAQRSAGAARQIKQLISSSVEKVSAGTGLVREAGSTMQEIVLAIERVNQITADIRLATHEQGVGISKVGTSVQALDEVTQQNAALVQQSAAAAQSLNEQAQGLMVNVSKFRLPAARRAPA